MHPQDSLEYLIGNLGRRCPCAGSQDAQRTGGVAILAMICFVQRQKPGSAQQRSDENRDDQVRNAQSDFLCEPFSHALERAKDHRITCFAWPGKLRQPTMGR